MTIKLVRIAISLVICHPILAEDYGKLTVKCIIDHSRLRGVKLCFSHLQSIIVSSGFAPTCSFVRYAPNLHSHTMLTRNQAITVSLNPLHTPQSRFLTSSAFDWPARKLTSRNSQSKAADQAPDLITKPGFESDISIKSTYQEPDSQSPSKRAKKELSKTRAAPLLSDTPKPETSSQDPSIPSPSKRAKVSKNKALRETPPAPALLDNSKPATAFQDPSSPLPSRRAKVSKIKAASETALSAILESGPKPESPKNIEETAKALLSKAKRLTSKSKAANEHEEVPESKIHRKKTIEPGSLKPPAGFMTIGNFFIFLSIVIVCTLVSFRVAGDLRFNTGAQERERRACRLGGERISRLRSGNRTS